VVERIYLPSLDAPFGRVRGFALCGALLALAGCNALEEPRNRAALDSGEGYQTTLRDFDYGEDGVDSRFFATSLRADVDLSRCRANTQYDALPVLMENRDEAPVSKGDLLRIVVRDDEMLSGDFEKAAHAGSAGFVDFGAALDLADALACLGRIGHGALSYLIISVKARLLQ